MAKIILKPLSEAENYRRRPTDNHGKLREIYFKVVNNTGAAGDDGSEIELGTLPPGAVRLLPRLATLRSSAFGAARVLAVGHRAYASQDGGVNVPEDPDAFSSGLDISAATPSITSPFGSNVKYDLYSKAGIRLFATVTGGTIPTNAELEGYLIYAYE